MHLRHWNVEYTVTAECHVTPKSCAFKQYETLTMVPDLTFELTLEKNGREWIRTTEGKSQQIYSLPRLATPEPALNVTTRAVQRRREAR